MTFPLRELAPNELISEPGFYKIPLATHHSQCCVGPSLTSGVLRKLEFHSPAEVWAFSPLNENRWPSEDKPALRLGRAMAAYLEGQMDVVALHFRVLPKGAPRRPTEQQRIAYEEGRASDVAKESIEFWDEIERDGRDIISADEMATIADMGRVLAADPAASAVMGGEPEVTMAWQDPETGIWCLARPDTVNFDGSVCDYKRIAAQGRPFDHRLVDRRISDFGFDMQLGWAAEGFEFLTSEWPPMAAIVAQSEKAPFHVILREIGEEDLRIGQWRNRRALRRFAECLASGHWPGPGDDVGAYQRPPKQREWLIEQMASGDMTP